MRKIRATVLVLTVIVIVLLGNILSSQTPAVSTPSDAIQLPSVCKTPLQPPRVSWQLPSDVEGSLDQKNFNIVQRASDIFAWQEFIALNWPATKGDRGIPAQNLPISSPGARVWETWKETSEVYLSSGADPLPWDALNRLPGGASEWDNSKVLFRQSKVDEVLHDDLQPTKADGTLPGTLTDQSGRVVYYEIRMNRVLFEYVLKNRLYQADKQALLPALDVPDGSMLIKAAWRVVEPDQESRFYTVPAYIVEPSIGPNFLSALREQKKVKYQQRKVGLVGFHVMHKTPSAPQWIWSTYEQVDNVVGDQPSFYNQQCTDCPTNRQTQPGFPNQVTRVTPIPAKDPDCSLPTQALDNVQELNRAVQKGLGDSVWRHYELIGTQWPVPHDIAERRPSTVFEVRPKLLANTTMETYIQGTSSCMGCHAMARTTNPGAFVSSDFSFTFSDALPRQSNAQLILPPTKPVTPWDYRHWNTILRGYQLSTQTYEQLPEYVPVAKLHCASCHLNAGGNPKASSWFGMIEKYHYPDTLDLQKRINLCFEHSLNGKPLPILKEDPNLKALIVYMQWLDEQARTLAISLPLSPYPPLAALTGDGSRGREIFEQKCAFCHNADGQGRYESNTYYRPALWGQHSFNQQAGMADTSKLAAFIHANMPLGSGGVLTAQEAWDLATWIDGQERPPGKRD